MYKRLSTDGLLPGSLVRSFEISARGKENMAIDAKYTHTNIVAQDWRKLADFYRRVFGCTPIGPERNLAGRWLEEGTGIAGAEIQGVHLLLPGHGEDGPTVEIFQYNHAADRPETAVNRPGFAHLAFAVEDVEAACQAVIAEGGARIGKTVSLDVPGKGRVTFAYLTDPEGNVLELQRWD
jgi:predicted enzyme related to lactoylglutathione lyase